jgi:hypothetical protein
MFVCWRVEGWGGGESVGAAGLTVLLLTGLSYGRTDCEIYSSFARMAAVGRAVLI